MLAITFTPLSAYTGYHPAQICTNRCVIILRKTLSPQQCPRIGFAGFSCGLLFPGDQELKKRKRGSINKPYGLCEPSSLKRNLWEPIAIRV